MMDDPTIDQTKDMDNGEDNNRFYVSTPATKCEMDALGAILSDTFHFDIAQVEPFVETVGLENFRIVRSAAGLQQEQGNVLGGLTIIYMGQWIQGKSIPMAGIVAVGIAPEHRGYGAATALMAETIRDLHKQGIPISTLFPATQPLYRRVGYEQAGSFYRMKLPTKGIRITDREFHIRRIEPDSDKDVKVVSELYQKRAIYTNGLADRGQYLWSRVRKYRGKEAVGFIVTNPNTRLDEGYLYYIKQDSDDFAYDFLLTDFVALSAGAARRLLTFLSDHQSMAGVVTWHGSPNDPVLLQLREQTYKDISVLHDHWMMRIIDVAHALEARPYQSGCDGEYHFEVYGDTVLPEVNNKRYILHINDQIGTVESDAGNGMYRIHINGLASLFTGHLTPQDLVVAGLLEADPVCLESLAAAFMSRAPWVADQW